MKITKEQFKNIVRETMIEENEYQEFFKKALEKTGKSIPDMSDEEKKAFFNKIDAAWDGKGEKNEGNAFGAAVSDAKEKGEDDFEVDGEKFKVEEANTISEPGAWVAFLSMTRGKKLLNTFNTARGAKQFLSKNVDKLLGGANVESVGIMSKKQWDEREAKYAIEGVNEAFSDNKNLNHIMKGRKITNVAYDSDFGFAVILNNGKYVLFNTHSAKHGLALDMKFESVNEASKPTIKVVSKLKNEEGIQIVVTKTTDGDTMYGGFVVRGKLQKVIPIGANNSKEGVKKRALQIWDEFGKQLGESVNEALLPADTKVVSAFFDKKPLEGKNLNTDGKVLKTAGIGSQEMYIHTPKGVKMVGKITGKYAQSLVQYVNKNYKTDLV